MRGAAVLAGAAGRVLRVRLLYYEKPTSSKAGFLRAFLLTIGLELEGHARGPVRLLVRSVKEVTSKAQPSVRLLLLRYPWRRHGLSRLSQLNPRTGRDVDSCL